MSADRRDFLQQLALGGLALGSLPTALRAASRPEVQSQAADVSWTKRVTGKHKAVFDSPDIEGGLGVIRAGVVAAQYNEVFKLAPGDFSTVIVLRHTGIHIAMNPTYWAQYKIGRKYNVEHPWTSKPLDTNPGLLTEDVPPIVAASSMDKQLARGAIVLGCSLAFADVVDIIGTADKLSAADADKKARSMLIPGVIMQPSGVFATTLAQENGCVYVRAT